MTERWFAPRLPGISTLLVDLILRVTMKRHSGGKGPVVAAHLTTTAERFRKSVKPVTPSSALQWELITLGGRPAEKLFVTKDPDPKKIILYFHGGGFFLSSPELHRNITSRLAKTTKRTVFAIDYRKAPDHAYPSWVDDGIAAYEELLAQGHRAEDIAFGGDSAGGNIALAVTHRARAKGLPLPEALLLLSPWADLSCSGESYRSNARRDAMFRAAGTTAMGAYLLQHATATDPEFSPIHADFTGFPRMLVFAGSTEVFLDDARTVVSRAKAAKVPAELHVYRHMPHVFPLFAKFIPAARPAFDSIVTFLRSAN